MPRVRVGVKVRVRVRARRVDRLGVLFADGQQALIAFFEVL